MPMVQNYFHLALEHASAVTVIMQRALWFTKPVRYMFRVFETPRNIAVKSQLYYNGIY